ncbi:sensor histidine kinase [Salipiger sp.]|uniref:sensor histidine kinase n=1 Tax=Salipiger sp. TaxID=2078585 RepID=UPI003A975254
MKDGRTLRGGSPAGPDARLDFTGVKAAERQYIRGWPLRIALLGTGAGLFFFLYGYWQLLAFFALKVAAGALHGRTMARLPDRGTWKDAVPALCSVSLAGASYLMAGMWLWVADRPIFDVYSLLLLIIAGLNTMAFRAHLKLFLFTDLILLCIGLAGRIGWLWWQDALSPDTLMLTFLLLASFAYYLLVLREVTRTHAELDASTEARSRQAQRTALSRFTGGVAHDFNNLLTAVLGNVELARLTDTPSEREALMNQAEQAARRGAELTGRLLALSSKARLNPARVSPATVVANLKDVAGYMFDDRYRLWFQVDASLPVIHVDESKLDAALLELVSNAVMSMPEGGAISMRAGRSLLFDPPGVCFEISDEGPGIPKEVQAMVFEPYFTTRPVGGGSGLGLAMVRGIVEQSGGTILLHSDAGAGTRIEVHLPAAAAEEGAQERR